MAVPQSGNSGRMVRMQVRRSLVRRVAVMTTKQSAAKHTLTLAHHKKCTNCTARKSFSESMAMRLVVVPMSFFILDAFVIFMECS